jgi:hypothetical protein
MSLCNHTKSDSCGVIWLGLCEVIKTSICLERSHYIFSSYLFEWMTRSVTTENLPFVWPRWTVRFWAAFELRWTSRGCIISSNGLKIICPQNSNSSNNFTSKVGLKLVRFVFCIIQIEFASYEPRKSDTFCCHHIDIRLDVKTKPCRCCWTRLGRARRSLRPFWAPRRATFRHRCWRLLCCYTRERVQCKKIIFNIDLLIGCLSEVLYQNYQCLNKHADFWSNCCF